MAKTGRPDETAIAKQLLALFEYLRQHGLFERTAYDDEDEGDPCVSVAETAEHFSLAPAEVVTLVSRLSCCRLGDYLYIPVYLDDEDRLIYGGPFDVLAHPIRFTEGECRALGSALDLAGIPDDADLRASLFSDAGGEGFDPSDFTKGHVLAGTIANPDRRETLTGILSAIEERRIMTITYPTDDVSEDQVALRRIEPLSVSFEYGRWYLNAFCLSRNGLRTFSLDRIVSAETTDETFDPAGTEVERFSARLREGLPLARLEFTADALIEKRDWPGAHLVETHDDGSRVIDVPDAGTAWLPEQIIALGGRVRILSPQTLEERVEQLRARRIAQAKLLEKRWSTVAGSLSRSPDVSSSIFRPYPSGTGSETEGR